MKCESHVTSRTCTCRWIPLYLEEREKEEEEEVEEAVEHCLSGLMVWWLRP